ncbi:hypothetical protein GUITHDRAFT_148067 [Guillardia theta CCMP2712]|uniref:Uncharacterized protein n=1 Tax=Guillardia theta (strain CCMP2712) TaxID=905079 RepID=L1IAV5_GUITC|nr:hypothetical protein GUITHDRAFT_148067 [Guillardia theta CCMP2712]EKX33227.1 hypothetical protein GUITHDRAFT_148067 [Guillardia theta CCMP2712]|eukprot:XP_005820207.1 hypothetical protein GUITHDRAFT_148067 [Guillardia theta CCMP2712]
MSRAAASALVVLIATLLVQYAGSQLVVSYSEMRGDVGRDNACQGPFPFQFTYQLLGDRDVKGGREEGDGIVQVDIRQAKGSTAIGWCAKGLDCSLQTVESVLKQSTAENLVSDCTFKPRTPADAGNSVPGYDPKVGIPDYNLKVECGAGQLCVEKGQHVRDIKPNCSPDRPCVSTSRKTPVNSRLFDNLHVPTSEPYVWGSLCRQYDYAEPATSAGGLGWLQGAWRSVNETLLFYLDINTCTCMPQCSACEVMREGVNTVDPTCAAVFPPSSSGVSALVNGEPKLCFMYAAIEGTRMATYEEMIRKRPEFKI